MARKKYCPVCYTELEVIDVAPCDDCGWDENEIQHFDEKKHVYAEFNVYGASLILCSFCDVDFRRMIRNFGVFREIRGWVMARKASKNCAKCR